MCEKQMNGARKAGAALKIAAIVPCFEEDENLIGHIADLVEGQDFAEVVLVDASEGAGREVASRVRARFAANASVLVLLDAPAGRARQMNTGARAATGDVLIFVHADTHLPEGCADLIEQSLNGDNAWGRFDVRLDASGVAFRVVEFMMNHRSRWTGITTGDQCQFMTRSAFDAVGGFPDQVLMEDIEMSKRLKRFGSPKIPGASVVTSARRWQANGVYKTIALMWKLRLMYFFGASPQTLANMYGNARSRQHSGGGGST